MSQVTLSNQSTWASKLNGNGTRNPNGFCRRWRFSYRNPLLKLVVLMGGHYSSWLSWPMFLNIHFSVLEPNILPTLVKPWWKVMPKKENSISGFSLSSMSFRLWSTQLVSPFCAQLSSPAPSQWSVLASLSGPSFSLQSFGLCYSLEAINS